MKKELEQILVEKYPEIFKNINGNILETAMYWGVECDDGWFWLIDNLCDTIQNYINNNSHLKIQQVVVNQVKEKFGGLRFYYSGGDNNIDGMVWLAENLSYKICENCGKSENVTQTTGWIKSLCENCIK